jgi:riboflavin kinase / FMN adenylyltransferase
VRTVFGLAEIPSDLPTPILALGTFDGVHLGHQQVIGQAVARARAVGGRAIAATFEPHPLEVLRPSAEPVLLTTLEERLGLFDPLGVDVAVVVPFDLEFSQLPARAWFDNVLVGRLGAREIFIGTSYTFGHRREGTASGLAEWGRTRGLPVHLVPAVLVNGEPVSSSRIRSALREGFVDEAAGLLGRWYGIRGQVVRGSGRGRTLGFPTANVRTEPRKVLPGRGVYATIMTVHDRRYGSATNIGYRPTFGGGTFAVEAHVLEFDGDLVGEDVTLAFVRRIRDERAFPGPEALVRQIRDDVARARELLAASEPGIIR